MQESPDPPRVAEETQEHPKGAITASQLPHRGRAGGRKMHKYFCSSKSITKMLLAEEQGIKPTLRRAREVKQSRGPSRDIGSILCHLCSCRQTQGQGTPAVGDKEASDIAAIAPCSAWQPRLDQPLPPENCNGGSFLDLQSRSSKRPPEPLG